MTASKPKKVRLLATVAAVAALVAVGSIYAATVQYEYDSLNRLVRVTYDEDSSIEYTYDALGNRTRKKVLLHLARLTVTSQRPLFNENPKKGR